MAILIISIFVIGYILIAMEHKTKIDKLIPALFMMTQCWAFISLNLDNITDWFDPSTSSLVSDFGSLDSETKRGFLNNTLLHHFGDTVEILIFLMGAMTIVAMIDDFKGFNAIKNLINTIDKTKLLYIFSALAFGLSAVIDNLTATIVLITILQRLVPNRIERRWFAGMIIIAANSGGAWTPIGDVTTTMLWMANKVTTGSLVTHVALPSVVSAIVPILIASRFKVFRGNLRTTYSIADDKQDKTAIFMFYLGLILIIHVPIFKMITDLPPYIGMMLSLSIFAVVAEIITNRQYRLASIGARKPESPTMLGLRKIEMPSILFFLGILMAVGALESLGLIFNFGQYVNENMSDNLFITLLGIGSAIVDNVPLVAASLGMFQNPMDDPIWHFLAYSAGTGGSILIIGSAAGVVAMGMEKIDFVWYMKNIALLALAGFASGVGVFLLMQNWMY